MLACILLELAIDGAAITPIDRQPIPERFQLSLWVVDFLILLHNGQDPLSDVEDGKMLTQDEKRLRSSTIFQRRCARTTSTDRIGLRRITGQDLLEPDLVPLQVTEVVFVGKALVRAEAEVSEADLPGIVGEGDSPHVGNPIGFTVNNEAVQMGVGPAKGELDEVVEKGDRGISAN